MLYLAGPENNPSFRIIPKTSVPSAVIFLLFSLQIDALKSHFISDRWCQLLIGMLGWYCGIELFNGGWRAGPMTSVHPVCRLMSSWWIFFWHVPDQTPETLLKMKKWVCDLPLLLCNYPQSAWNVPEILFTSYIKHQQWWPKVEEQLKLWSTHLQS